MAVVISPLKYFTFQKSVVDVLDKLFMFQLQTKTNHRSVSFISLRCCFRSHLDGGCGSVFISMSVNLTWSG